MKKISEKRIAAAKIVANNWRLRKRLSRITALAIKLRLIGD